MSWTHEHGRQTSDANGIGQERFRIRLQMVSWNDITMIKVFSAPGERIVKFKCVNKAECRRIKYILHTCHCVPKNGYAFLVNFGCGEEFSTFDNLNCVLIRKQIKKKKFWLKFNYCNILYKKCSISVPEECF